MLGSSAAAVCAGGGVDLEFNDKVVFHVFIPFSNDIKWVWIDTIDIGRKSDVVNVIESRNMMKLYTVTTFIEINNQNPHAGMM